MFRYIIVRCIGGPFPFFCLYDPLEIRETFQMLVQKWL